MRELFLRQRAGNGRGRKNGGGNARRTPRVSRVSMPAALHPFEPTPTFQPSPESYRAVPLKLVARADLVLNPNNGALVISTGDRERTFVWRHKSSATNTDTPSYGYITPMGYPATVSDTNIAMRYVSRALRLIITGPRMYAAGIVHVLVTMGGYSPPADNLALNTYHDWVVAHPRTARFQVSALLDKPLDIMIPVRDSSDYHEWRDAFGGLPVPTAAVLEEPYQIVHVAFSGLPDYSVATMRADVVMHEKAEFVFPATSTTQLHHATHATCQSPDFIFKAKQWLGHEVDDALGAVRKGLHFAQTHKAAAGAAGAIAGLNSVMRAIPNGMARAARAMPLMLEDMAPLAI